MRVEDRLADRQAHAHAVGLGREQGLQQVLARFFADAGATADASALATALTTTATHYTAIDTSARAGSPFDVQIMTENFNSDSAVYKTIVALNAQANLIADLAESLNIETSVVDEEASACDTSDPTATCD